MWWLRYFWLRLMFILTLVNIMTCVGAWYAVSSSYGDLKTFIVMVPYKITWRFQEFVGTAKFATHYARFAQESLLRPMGIRFVERI